MINGITQGNCRTRESAQQALRDVGIVLGLYAATTLLYALLGVTFDATPAEYFMQFIDPKLLKERLTESIWFYHATPPLLNLIYATGLNVFGAHQTLFFSLLYHAFGVMISCAVYLLTLKLSSSRIAAGVVTALLLLNPDFVMFQNWFMYEFPAVACLTFSAWALYRYVQTRSMKWCAIFFVLLAALLLTRSVFHLAWMVLVVGILAVVCRESWRQVLTAAALPLLVVAGWYGKNLYYFGSFSSSTWLGLGFANISTLVLPRPELEQMVQRGEISGLALVSRYTQLDVLFNAQDGPPSGIPVLDDAVTSTKTLNFNYRPLIALGRTYFSDGIKVIEAHPSIYVMGIGLSNRLFFSPNHINPFFLRRNRQAAEAMHRWMMPVLYGVPMGMKFVRVPRFGWNNGPDVPIWTSVPLIIEWVLFLGYGYLQARQRIRAKDRTEQARAVVLLFIVSTCLYVYAVGTAVELGENSRYRFLVEPLFMVLAATAVTALVRTVRRLGRPDTSARSGEPREQSVSG